MAKWQDNKRPLLRSKSTYIGVTSDLTLVIISINEILISKNI